jgi:hypothetical protein
MLTLVRTVSVMLALLAVFAARAEARKPIIAYVDGTTHKLAMYDAETGTALTPPPVTITSTPGFQDAMAMSFDGRFVFYVGSDDKLHLYDRTGSGSAVPLSGIDIYTKPTGLAVSNNGLLAFDNNVNGPAVVYDSATGAFVDTGLPDPNADRQSHLSGDGHFLATTCNGNAMTCPADNGGHSQYFVQDLVGRTDTANPPFGFGGGFDADDKEHPCINGDGSIVGADVNEGGTVGKQVEIYDRTAGSLITPMGLNSAGDDTHCVLSQGPAYIGLQTGGEFKVFERSSNSFLTLPANIKAIINPVSFVMPFPPPSSTGGTPAPPSTIPDRTAPLAKKHFRKRYGLAGALKHGLLGTVTSNEAGSAAGTATIIRSATAAKVVARGSARLRAGRPAKLRLKFTRRAKRQLAHARRVPLTIRITVKDLAGNATRITLKTLLRA